MEGDWVVTEGVDSKLVYIKSSFDFNQNLLYIFFGGGCLLLLSQIPPDFHKFSALKCLPIFSQIFTSTITTMNPGRLFQE